MLAVFYMDMPGQMFPVDQVHADNDAIESADFRHGRSGVLLGKKGSFGQRLVDVSDELLGLGFAVGCAALVVAEIAQGGFGVGAGTV